MSDRALWTPRAEQKGAYPLSGAEVGWGEVIDPDVLAAEIVEALQAALEQFREIAEELGAG